MACLVSVIMEDLQCTIFLSETEDNTFLWLHVDEHIYWKIRCGKI